ncbi:MAG: CheR family methyltransferase [Bacillota bacterium]|nr:protein-glutamate O-methyltransferase CheR [Candidatus Fermentithermobacillaceae bacterium]
MSRQFIQSRDDINTYGTDYVHFCMRLKKLTDIDLASYKAQQMHRRLLNYKNRQGLADFYALSVSIQKDPKKLAHLVDFLTINVSEFFRNEEHWKVLRASVLPPIVKARAGKPVEIWSAGSSAGQEAYSLAMTVLEAGGTPRVLGTDIDEPSLAKAREGSYSSSEIEGLDRLHLAKYFDKTPTGYKVREVLKRSVLFERRNLLSDPYPRDLDLAVCRNVLIYFTDKGKQQVLRGLADSLRPGGVLFTGATEAVFNPSAYGLKQIYPFFYERA